MSRELIVQMRCDLHEQCDADETVTLAVEDTTYIIDLCTPEAAELHKKLQPYLNAAHHVVGPKGRGKTSSIKSEKNRREQNKLIRTWARTNGIEIGDKGQVPVEVRRAFECFQPTKESPQEVAARHGKKGGEIAKLRALPKDVRDEIRAWALAEGLSVSARGFISADVVKAFEDAHKLKVSA